jgi:hypothetical protein
MVITRFDFERMSLAEQGEAVWKGTYIGERRENGVWIQCYSLESFYVEVFYDDIDNHIIKMGSFTQVSSLVPYMISSINQRN